METSEMVTKVQDAFELLRIPKQERSSDGNVYLDIKASDIYKSLAGEEISRERDALLRYTEAMEKLAEVRSQLQLELNSVSTQFKSVEKMAEISRVKIDACERLFDPETLDAPVAFNADSMRIFENEGKQSAILKVFHALNPNNPEQLALSANKIAAGLTGTTYEPKHVSMYMWYQLQPGRVHYFRKASNPKHLEHRVSTYWELTEKGMNALIGLL